jgi:hypothetical protein
MIAKDDPNKMDIQEIIDERLKNLGSTFEGQIFPKN